MKFRSLWGKGRDTKKGKIRNRITKHLGVCVCGWGGGKMDNIPSFYDPKIILARISFRKAQDVLWISVAYYRL